MTDAERQFLAQMALGMFSVDSEGRIWRHRRVSNGSRLQVAPTIEVEPPTRAETGESKDYLRLQFTVGEERFQVYAHRIVWMVTNHSDIPALIEVNHKDGDGSNNRPSNLELMTKAENQLHAIHVLGRFRATNHPGGKLTPQQVVEIRGLCDAKSMAQALIARQYGVSVRSVGAIANRKTYSEIPG